MKKTFFPVMLLFLLLSGCMGPSQEDFYGWWKLESQTMFQKEGFIYISSAEIVDSRQKNKILRWEKKDESFQIITQRFAVDAKIDDNGMLSITPIGGSPIMYSKSTEEKAKEFMKAQEEKDKKKFESRPDPF